MSCKSKYSFVFFVVALAHLLTRLFLPFLCSVLAISLSSFLGPAVDAFYLSTPPTQDSLNSSVSFSLLSASFPFSLFLFPPFLFLSYLLLLHQPAAVRYLRFVAALIFAQLGEMTTLCQTSNHGLTSRPSWGFRG